jgi:hypothetical protein
MVLISLPPEVFAKLFCRNFVNVIRVVVSQWRAFQKQLSLTSIMKIGQFMFLLHNVGVRNWNGAERYTDGHVICSSMYTEEETGAFHWRVLGTEGSFVSVCISNFNYLRLQFRLFRRSASGKINDWLGSILLRYEQQRWPTVPRSHPSRYTQHAEETFPPCSVLITGPESSGRINILVTLFH